MFLGCDAAAKDKKLTQLKNQYQLIPTQHFNVDVLYGRETTAVALQESLRCLPVDAQYRLVVIKQADALKDEAKKYLLGYAQKPRPNILVVIDCEAADSRDTWVRNLARLTEVVRFQEAVRVDTFTLYRQIQSRRADAALKLLSELLRGGEKPERILGGLRFALEKDFSTNPEDARKKLSLLIACDNQIKTGRIRADFALERLAVTLCGLVKQ